MSEPEPGRPDGDEAEILRLLEGDKYAEAYARWWNESAMRRLRQWSAASQRAARGGCIIVEGSDEAWRKQQERLRDEAHDEA